MSNTTGRLAARNSLVGSWRIVEMEMCERNDIDEQGPARIQFNRDGTGELRFLLVQGGIDCHFEMRDGSAFVEFSWSGLSEMDEACGRGWAELESDSRLKRHVFFHLGDDSAFAAVRQRTAHR
jgi:hypothetical protein